MNKYMTETLLNKILSSFAYTNIVVVGDLIADVYMFGDVSRISPEAPVPVFNFKEQRTALGGAGNVALIAKDLNAKPCIIARAGNDVYGREIKKMLKDKKIEFICLNKETVVKSRVIASNQQIVRIDKENIKYTSQFRFLWRCSLAGRDFSLRWQSAFTMYVGASIADNSQIKLCWQF